MYLGMAVMGRVGRAGMVDQGLPSMGSGLPGTSRDRPGTTSDLQIGHRGLPTMTSTSRSARNDGFERFWWFEGWCTPVLGP